MSLTKNEIKGSVGNATSIKCVVSNPLPVSYNWTKNLNPIHYSDNIRMYNNSLVVKPLTLDDFGVYVCHVTNIAGYANYSITFVQAPEMDDTSKYFKANKHIYLYKLNTDCICPNCH